MLEKFDRIVLDSDVFVLTELGRAELGGAGTSLPPEELEVLILIDGRSTAAETARRVQSFQPALTLRVLGKLFVEKRIELANDHEASLDFAFFFKDKGLKSSEDAVTSATEGQKKEADATAALLQEKGFSVGIARRAERVRALGHLRGLTAMIVEDEPHLQELLKHVLTQASFKVRTAKNREEIVAGFRQSPIPDLVLLDVVLPDADGFAVLEKMRQHPALKEVPVVMLTSLATRAAVLKGLAGGADGYITKPFKIDVLTRAVSAVLGLPEPGSGTKGDIWSQ